MSTFLDHRIEPPAGSQTLRVAWHPSMPLLAVSFSDHSVAIFSNTGEKLEEDITRIYDCSTLAWHPKKRILVMGWADGAIVTMLENGDLIEDTNIHVTQVFVTSWSEKTYILVTGDGNGSIGVWKMNESGHLQNIQQYKRNGAIKHIAFIHRNISGTVAAPMTRFFVGGESGIGICADDLGNCSDAFSVSVPISAVMYDEEKAVLVCITSTMVLNTFKVGLDGSVTQLIKVKLGAGGGLQQALWAGKGILATVANEGMVRMWNMDKDEHYFIVPSSLSGQKLSCAAYDPKKKLLAAGATSGSIVLWKYIGGADDEMAWELFDEISLRDQSIVTNLIFGFDEGTLVVAQPEAPTILLEVILMRQLAGSRAALQLAADKVALVGLADEHYAVMPTSIRMIGGALSSNSMAIWSGEKVEVYGLGEDGIQVDLAGSFDTRATSIAIHESGSVLVGLGHRVDLCNAQGTVKQTIEFSELEGVVKHIDVMGRYAVIVTDKKYVKIYDLKRREARAHSAGAFFPENNLEIIHAYVNSNGSAVALICKHIETDDDQSNTGPDSRIHVYFGDKDTFQDFNFVSQQSSRYPVDCRWDQRDARLLAIHTRGLVGAEGDEVTSLFVTQDARIVPQEASPILFKDVEGEEQDESEEAETAKSLIGICVPNLYFSTHSGRLVTVPMSDFAGIGDAGPETTSAMMDFSYYLTIGNMDEAFKTVRVIRSSAIWHSMAAVCVKTKRLDVAQICLGHMGHARAVRGLRDAVDEEPVEAKLAVVAIHLGLVDEAERLYRECERFDLLNNMYQASGKWEESIAIAENEDRIHLKPTYIKYAQHLASNGDVPGAVRAFEKADGHRTFVPRLLQSRGAIRDLQQYIANAHEDDLTRWWGQFCESSGDYDKALEAYEEAGDVVSRVRVVAFLGDTEKAADIALAANHPGAAYHMARHFEAQDELSQAIRFHTLAGRYNHAVRLAKELNDVDTVVDLALQSGDRKLEEEAAMYFEEHQIYDKAVTLYHRAGSLAHAADLCFRANLYDQLKEIGDDLDRATDPTLLERCADFFMENGQLDKSVRMLVKAGSPRALDVALEHKIALTKEIVESITPDKKDPNYITVVLKIAIALENQGSFREGAQFFMKGKEIVKGMRCLLRSGENDKIIKYARTARLAEVKILAANYLQGLNWHEDPTIMTAITQFYSSAKAYDPLSGFFDAAAQIEIDNYQNYEKGLGALKDASSTIQRAIEQAKKGDGSQLRMLVRRQTDLARKIQLVEKFVMARDLFNSDGPKAVDVCNELLEESDLEPGVRTGDVYAVLVEYHHLEHHSSLAHRLLERMRAKGIPVSYYVEDSLVKEVHAAAGAPMPDDIGEQEGSEVEDAVESDMEMEEEVVDDIEDSD